MSDSREDLRRRAESDGIEFFFAMFVDMHGKPCAKLVPADSFDLLMDGGAGFAGFAAGPMGQTPADPDLIAVPDPASYTQVPWQPFCPGSGDLRCHRRVRGQRVVVSLPPRHPTGRFRASFRPRSCEYRLSTPVWGCFQQDG